MNDDLDCPFCKVEQAALLCVDWNGKDEDPDGYYIFCMNCHREGVRFLTEEEAIEDWISIER